MPKKKKSSKKAAAPSRAEKRTTAQKKVAKALKRPAVKPAAEAPREIPTPTERKEPSPTPGFALPTEVSPQIREAYKSRFEEAQLADIGREPSAEEAMRREQNIAEMGTPAEPEAIKAVRGETSIPETERPLTPKVPQEEEPTVGQQVRRQAGRLPRGAGGTGPFTFQTATREENIPGVKTIRDIARQSQKGRSISPLSPHAQATALALAKRDHDLARSTGKVVNGISPEDAVPDEYSIRGTHHERLGEVIHAYGAKEEDFNKLPGKADLPTKVNFAWSTLKEHERSKRKTSLWPESEGATHWEDPKTGKVKALALGEHPEFYRHEGETQSIVRGPGESSWKAVTPTVEGWHVINLRGQKTWKFRGHPAEPFKDTHQVRSVFQHIQNILKGDFPEAPITTSDSAASRRRAAEHVRKKFILMSPEPQEAAGFDPNKARVTGPVERGGTKLGSKFTITRERGRTKRTAVSTPVNKVAAELGVTKKGGKLKVSRADVFEPSVRPDNVTIQETSEQEVLGFQPRQEQRRRKVVQEPGGRRVVRPQTKDENERIGYMAQQGIAPGVKSEQTKQIEKQLKRAEILPPTGKPKTAFTTTVVPAEPNKPKSTKLKKVYTPIPKAEQQVLPGMETVGVKTVPARKIKTTKLIPVEGPITAGQAEAERVSTSPSSIAELNALRGRVALSVPTEITQPAYTVPERPQPKPEGPFAGETGMEQLRYIQSQAGLASQRGLATIKPKKQAARVIDRVPVLRGTDTAATRNVPQQLELPGFESPGYAGAMGQQFRQVSPETGELQRKSQQGAVPGAAAELPRGVAPKKSTRSSKKR